MVTDYLKRAFESAASVVVPGLITCACAALYASYAEWEALMELTQSLFVFLGFYSLGALIHSLLLLFFQRASRRSKFKKAKDRMFEAHEEAFKGLADDEEEDP